MNGRTLLPLLGLAAFAGAQSDERDASDARCRELVAAQAAGRFDVAAALAALGHADEAVARTAAAIVRHEWLALPSALLDGLDARPGAARVLLHELAVAPRPAAAAWAARWAGEAAGRSLDDRCLGVAARGAPFTLADGDLLLRTLAAGEAEHGFRAAATVLPARIADALLGKVHAGLAAGRFGVDHAGPLLDRVSPDGVRQMLGLVVSLPEATAAALCTRVNERLPELVAERVQAALDGDAPLDAIWLPFTAPLLTSPARIARVAAVLHDEAAPAATRHQAFLVLVEAKAIDEALLAYAAGDDGGRESRLRRLLDRAIDAVPAALLIEWLHGDPRVSALVVQALTRRLCLEPELEEELAKMLREAGLADGPFHGDAALALAQRGSRKALQAIWPLLRSSRGWPEYIGALARRSEPFVPELLLAELAEKVPDVGSAVRAEQLDAIALALVALGDRRELERLVGRAKSAPPSFVRRCSHYARPLAAPFARRLLADALVTTNGDVAVELVAWAATAAADAGVRDVLLGLWREPPQVPFAAELQDTALRALAEGPLRGELAAELRAAIQKGPVPPRLEPLDFELLGSMPSPPAAGDLELCCDLVLLVPRTDPESEAEQARRWPDGFAGFPLVAAVAERLRGADPAAAAAAFTAAARAAAADPRHVAIAPPRLLVLWRELVVAPAVQRAVATSTAALVLASSAPGDVATGPASWFAMQAAVDRGQFAAARRHAEVARDELLRLPSRRRYARVFLGERDPGGGADPWAALAAWPHAIDVLAGLAAGDAAAAHAAAVRAREFAGHDARIHAMLSTRFAEDVR